MNERAPRKVTAPVRHNPDTFSHAGQQMSLLDDAPVPMPVAPNPGTLAARMLDLLAAGAALTHPDFERITDSWRLAAWAHELNAMGWRILVERVAAPTPDRPDRTIARYQLDGHHAAAARAAMAGGGRN